MPFASHLHRLSAAALVLYLAGAAGAQCVGDCDGGGAVEINELVTGVNIALGSADLSACTSFDVDGSGAVEINELIAAVGNALSGCPATPTPPADTPTAESSATATSVATQTATSTAVATSTAPATPTDTTAPTLSPTVAATATSTTSATQTAAPSDSPTVAATDTATANTSPSVTETATPTPSSLVPSATFTPTATATMGTSAVCGNRVLEPGESCAGCAADCTIGPCTATATMLTFNVLFEGPLGTFPTTATTLLGYHSGHVSIPGSASAVSVRQRVTFPAPLPNVISINDLDYAVRVVVGRSAGLTEGTLYSVKVDSCQGAPAITAADFACTMEACAGSSGPIEGCTCSVVAP